MLIQVREFCERVERRLPYLLDALQTETGRTNPAEREAWSQSFSRLCEVLSDPNLRDFHLALEYRLPASASFCDVVLLGRGDNRPSAVVLELKHWATKGDQPGPRPALVQHQGTLTLHPSEQVRGYVDYFRNFHSTVQEDGADVSGCVLFTDRGPLAPYRLPPHDDLVAKRGSEGRFTELLGSLGLVAY